GPLRDLGGRRLSRTFPLAQGLLATADNQQPDTKSQARKELSQLHHSKPFFPDRLTSANFARPTCPVFVEPLAIDVARHRITMSLMPAIRFDIISIGTLSRNRLWNETQDLRTAHSTTTLIRSGNRNILVDPGLPPPALAARLHERAGLSPDRIDTVFLTNFRPDHRAGLSIFSKAKTCIHELEQQAVSAHLQRLLEEAPLADIDSGVIKRELDLLMSLKTAPDKLADNLDLF